MADRRASAGRVSAPGGVSLPEGHTGSSFFHHVLHEAVERFPDELGAAELPGAADAFKKGYDEALVRFEAVRAASARRAEIARHIVRRTQEQLRYLDGARGEIPFSEYVRSGRDPFEVERVEFPGTPGLTPSIGFEGEHYRGAAVERLVTAFERRDYLSGRAAAALRWIAQRPDDGRIDLSGERFVVMGAAAELSPVPLLLEAGADVLWVDVAAPDALLQNPERFAGSLSYAAGGMDLLERPGRIAASIARFAAEGAVHIGMFAYAGGASREWRLMACMNGIVRSLDPALVRSVALYISPTHPAVVAPEDVAADARRFDARPAWQAMLHSLGALPRNLYAHGDIRVTRAVVPIQGPSYQAAQYVSKLLAAEAYAVYGTHFDVPRPVTVSANVAPITETRSLKHPLFQAAFIGAPRFGVEIFKPATTRHLSGLMMFHDLLNPGAPGASTTGSADAERAAVLLSQQVHGGIYGMPWALYPAIRISAMIGISGHPGLLFRALGA